MKVCVVGIGYVGLVVSCCLAEMGNDVVCVDNDKNKLEELKKGNISIYEPELAELLLSNLKEKRLEFTTDIDYAVKKSLICFIAVGTPSDNNGSAELKYVYDVAKSIGKAIDSYKIIVNKSTVPVGTGEIIKEIIKKETNIEFDIVSNPEFLKQGNAVDDFLKPDRVVIGAESNRALELMKQLYSPYLRTSNPIITMDIKSAEMSKYASNSFLATKISFINQIANISKKVGADIEMVRKVMCTDKRIGNQFLFSGIGYGGSCFPKDIRALIKTANENDCDCDLLSAVENINKKQRIKFTEMILDRFQNDIKNKTFAVWGLAFKPRTNDIREAPSITIINELLDKGANIVVYDPKAMKEFEKLFKNRVKYSFSMYETLNNADSLLLLTEWNEFRQPDFDKIKNLLKLPIIFDGRNQYNYNILLDKGFEYYNIGRK